MTRRRVLLGVTALVLVGVLMVGLALFQPWKIWTHSRVDEALPGLSDHTASAPIVVGTPTDEPVVATSGGTTTPTPTPKPVPVVVSVVVSRATFVSGEHTTTGTALLVKLPDGTFTVRLENFDTSDGPDVRIVLATTPAGSRSVGRYLHLGRMKATSGNQNYPVPAGTDLAAYQSVVVWCKRFDAVFGSAPLRSAGLRASGA